MNDPAQFSEAANAQRARYEHHMRRMQTGVAMLMNDPTDKGTQPKHLRVGVNACLVDSSALALLLVKKGLISDEEYFTARADGAEAEADRYEQLATERLGSPVKLGPAGGFGQD